MDAPDIIILLLALVALFVASVLYHYRNKERLTIVKILRRGEAEYVSKKDLKKRGAKR